jgi:PPK2 family polyphosphate:nucleotide phosphotransferase
MIDARARAFSRPYRVEDGRKFKLSRIDPADTAGLKAKEEARDHLRRGVERLKELQDLLYAQDRWALLLVFQAMDAAGKDSTIEHVMSGVNPQGCQVYSFKGPSPEELDHDFLWRTSKCLPERGRIGIFNRSYYEEVLVVRVHPEILQRQKLPPGRRNEDFWRKRFESINDMEHHLSRNGTLILKFFLHLSRGEQKRRFMERLDNPEKHWKFSIADLAERGFWKEYQEAFAGMLEATSTRWAPWHVVPADRKYVARAMVADIITSRIRRLDLRYPKLDAAANRRLVEARRRLQRE